MGNNEKLYIDQKVAESFFRELLQEKKVYRVFNLYGESGIGKTTFLNHIENKYLINNSNYAIVKIDFANRLMHNPKYAIMHIAKGLESKYDYDFISLWKAYAILWQKRYDNSLIMYANDLPYVHEIKKLLNIDKKGKSFIRIIKGLFRDNIYKELEALKALNTKDIEKKLFFFFAEDFKNMLKSKNLKDSIIVIDNYTFLEERFYESPCKKDAWIRELVSYLGKNTLFVISSKEPISWDKCNIALKSNVKEYLLKPLSTKDAKRYLKYFAISEDKFQETLLTLTSKKPYLLYIAKEAYSKNSNYKTPVVLDELYKDFFSSLNDNEIKILEILANTRVIRADLLSSIAKKFNVEISSVKINQFLKKEYFKEYGKSKFYLDNTLKAKILSELSEDDKKEYLSFIFSYYENILQNLDKELIQNTPELIDEIIEEAWYYLRLINKNVNKHLEWLNYYVSRFYMYAAWETFIERYLQIMPKIEKEGSEENKIELYNNLAGLYESIGEAKLAREYYNKVVKLNRPQKLIA